MINIILRDIQHTARLHGNGFIQVDLPNDHRLHIFYPKLISYGQKVRTTGHTHTFDMTSYILYGTLIHRHFKLIPGNLFELYSCAYNGNRTVESSLQRSIEYPFQYNFELLAENSMVAGSKYYFRHNEWHESISNDFVVTIIRKDHIKDAPMPYVACPIGLKPDNEYKRDSIPFNVLDEIFQEVYYHVGEKILNKLINDVLNGKDKN